MYFLVRGYVLGARIYPMKYTLHQLFSKVKTSFVRELNRHFVSRQEKFQQYQKRPAVSPPADILGGPWRG